MELHLHRDLLIREKGATDMPGQSDRGQVVALVSHTGRSDTGGHDQAADDSEDGSRVRVVERPARVPHTRLVSPRALSGYSRAAMTPFNQRLLTARVLEALEGRVKQFRRREELWPIRMPPEPSLSMHVIQEALGEDSRRFDPGRCEAGRFCGWNGTTEARWDAWVIALPSKTKLLLRFGRRGDRLLASGDVTKGTRTIASFFELLAETGGQAFGIETSGDAPTRVRSSITDRAFLVEFFVDLFEVTGDGGISPDSHPRHVTSFDHDFQPEVEVWLATVLQR